MAVPARYVVCWLLLGLRLTTAEPAGAQLRITQPGITLAASVAGRKMADRLRTERIPDFSGSSGRSSYRISSIAVQSVSIPAPSVTATDGRIETSLCVDEITIRGDWWASYKRGWLKLSKSGSAVISARGACVKQSITMGMTSSGQPTIHATPSACHANINKMDVKFHGSFAWLLNIFSSYIESRLKDALAPKICPKVVEVINNKGEAALRDTKLMLFLPKWSSNLAIDYRLTSNPVAEAGRLDALLKSAAVWTGDTTPLSHAPAPLTMDESHSSKMLYIELSDYVLNSLSEVLYRHHRLHLNLTKTVSIEDTDMRVEASVRTLAPPRFRLDTSQLLAECYTQSKLSVTAGSVTQHLVVNVNASMSMAGVIESNKLILTVQSFTTSVDNVGQPLAAAELNDLINKGLMPNIIQIINQKGQDGVDLPVVKWASYQGASLEFRPHSIIISTDIAVNDAIHQGGSPGGGSLNKLMKGG